MKFNPSPTEVLVARLVRHIALGRLLRSLRDQWSGAEDIIVRCGLEENVRFKNAVNFNSSQCVQLSRAM